MSTIISNLRRDIDSFDESLVQCKEDADGIILEEYVAEWTERNNNSDAKHRGHLYPTTAIRRNKETGSIKTIEIRWVYFGYRSKDQHKFSGAKPIKKGRGFLYTKTSIKEKSKNWEFELAWEIEQKLAKIRKTITDIGKAKKMVKSIIRSLEKTAEIEKGIDYAA